MRVNIYAEEMPDEPRIEIIEKEIDGNKFTALRIYLELPVSYKYYGANDVSGIKSLSDTPQGHISGPFIHRPGDDDSAAVTFWGKRDLRKVLRKALTALDEHYATRPSHDWRREGVDDEWPRRAPVEGTNAQAC